MGSLEVTLHDRFDLGKDRVLLNGTQALVRLMLMQAARDRAAGLNTAGFVMGYRGSPLGAVDQQMMRARADLEKAQVKFQAGLNEDLAATAIWGSQQAELRGEGAYDGVFALWYGKGPGVDRSGDVMRHANMAGTSPHGGVVMAMGDDHTGESSTTLHQSDWALVDAYMPVLSPAGVQEILDYGLYGYALSRFAGVWAGLKTVKDTVEATAVVDGRPDRMSFVTPDFTMPEGGLNIRLIDTPVAQEARMIDYKRHAAEAFSHANKMDHRVWGRPGAKIGFVAAGKNWLDLTHALSLLGIDAEEAARLGLTTYKIGQVWPLDMRGFSEWAEGLDLIVVVEEKRKLIEVQVKEAIFDRRNGRRVYGWKNDRGEFLFQTQAALDPVMIAQKLGGILIEEGRATDNVKGALERIDQTAKIDNGPDAATRVPYFCSGCPHNSSTKVPEGHRAYAGIGCHYMVQWMDRDTQGFTQMGGEGANWVGESLFSTRKHVFQNLGDGTYNHSGLMAIRAAIAAGTNITYKILYNDAVAMTGGQANEGDLSPQKIAAEVLAAGVNRLTVVYDPKEAFDPKSMPNGIECVTRDQMEVVQKELSEISGVTAIIYVQTCAAEKRRRRKRGNFPDPDRRVMINPDVCEGCGDCGVQSNCVSVVPLDTELGRKRAIDQSSCNKDFSCLDGFCPSFVTVHGGKIRKQATTEIDIGHLPDPEIPAISGTYNMVITGVGGTGVVTIGAVLAQAAQLDGKGAGMMEMAGLAQKGGAVHIHCRLANDPADISAIRVATGEADCLIGGDMVVTAGAKTLELVKPDTAQAVVNSHQITTGDFTRDANFTIPFDQLDVKLHARLRGRLTVFDASKLAEAVMGDTIFSNMILLGAAWQQGLVPLSHDAITKAVQLNGAAVERNLRAFEIGRWAVLNQTDLEGIVTSEVSDKPLALQEKIDFRAEHLRAYQGAGLARKYRALVDRAEDPDLRDAIAEGYHKVLSYKDEYEVARLHRSTAKQVAQTFEGRTRLTYHMAPPVISAKGSNGRPVKRALPGWIMGPALGVLSLGKVLRGTPLDPFGYQKDRRLERALIREYETDMELALSVGGPAAVDLARLPLDIRGFGPVKEVNQRRAAKTRESLLAQLRADQTAMPVAAE